MSDKQLSRADFEALQNSLEELNARNDELVQKMAEMDTRDLAGSTTDAFFQLKREQGDTLQRINFIYDQLEDAKISIGEDDFSQVDIGNRVTAYSKETKSIMTFDIVGTIETESDVNRVTADSPFGEAVLGKKRDETFAVDTPEGTDNYRIVDILAVPSSID
ncbi:MAG: hypothetical protein Phog2KO_48330 [Phototrophicaceae bacterium]